MNLIELLEDYAEASELTLADVSKILGWTEYRLDNLKRAKKIQLAISEIRDLSSKLGIPYEEILKCDD